MCQLVQFHDKSLTFIFNLHNIDIDVDAVLINKYNLENKQIKFTCKNEVYRPATFNMLPSIIGWGVFTITFNLQIMYKSYRTSSSFKHNWRHLVKVKCLFTLFTSQWKSNKPYFSFSFASIPLIWASSPSPMTNSLPPTRRP